MKRISLSGVLICVITQLLMSQDFTPPAEAIQAASENFTQFLTNAVTEETKTMVGFDAEDDLSKAVLGNPFRLFRLLADSIRNYNGIAPLRDIVNESDMWYFPIVIDEKIKMMLYVGKKDGKWMRAGLGSAGLSRQMQEITSQWSSSAGFTPMIVQQQNVGAYFYNIPQVDNYNLTETASALTRTGLSESTSQLKTLDAAINDLRSRISR